MKLRVKDIAMKPKLISLFLLVGILPLAVVGWWSSRHAAEALMEKSFSQLEAIRSIKQQQIASFFEARLNSVEILSKSADTHLMYKELLSYHIDTNVQADGPYDANTPRYKAIWKEKSGDLANYMHKYGYYDVFIICAKHGHVMYTAAKEADLGTNLGHGPYRDSGLAKLWQRVVETRKGVIEDFGPYAPSNNEPAAFIGYPVFDADKKLVAVVALQLSLESINTIMEERDGLGESGESYLVGPDKLMRSDSYLDPHGHSVKASFAGTVKKNGVDTLASQKGLAGQTGAEIVLDYNGNPVLSAYGPVQVGDTTWALMAEIDEAEVRQPVNALVRSILIDAVIAVALIALVAFIVAGHIIKPLIKGVEFAGNVANGDLASQLDIDQKDEIGQLAGALNSMVANLRQMMQNINENSSQVATASEELSATSQQMAAGAEEMTSQAGTVAAAAEEIGVNMNTVSTTAAMMNGKSDDIASSAREMTENVNSVAAAIEEMSASIGEVAQNSSSASDLAGRANELSSISSEEMEKLDKAAGEIGNVINLITEITEQTKLLSLNATIEAARAGEAGKGFAVVANEVKDLARQTSEATGEIVDRIQAMQSQTSGVVDNINKMSKVNRQVNEINTTIAAAIEEQSATTNEIARTVNETSAAVSVVAENIQELSTNIEQEILGSVNEAVTGAQDVSANIQGVSTVSGDTAQGAVAINQASTELASLATHLQGQVARFTI